MYFQHHHPGHSTLPSGGRVKLRRPHENISGDTLPDPKRRRLSTESSAAEPQRDESHTTSSPGVPECEGSPPNVSSEVPQDHKCQGLETSASESDHSQGADWLFVSPAPQGRRQHTATVPVVVTHTRMQTHIGNRGQLSRIRNGPITVDMPVYSDDEAEPTRDSEYDAEDEYDSQATIDDLDESLVEHEVEGDGDDDTDSLQEDVQFLTNWNVLVDRLDNPI